MFENDWLSRQIEIVSRSLSVLLMGKDSAFNITEEESGDELIIGEESMLLLMMKKYLNDNRLNEAEDMLFESIDQGVTEQKLQIALWFYEELDDIDQAKLKRGGFSRQEIEDGMEEIKKLYEKLNNAKE